MCDCKFCTRNRDLNIIFDKQTPEDKEFLKNVIENLDCKSEDLEFTNLKLSLFKKQYPEEYKLFANLDFSK